MNTETHTVQGSVSESILGGIATGSVTEGIGAIGAIILAIIGLAGIYTNIMAAIATIIVGAVILMDGGLVGLAGHRLHTQSVNASQARQLGSGVTAGFFGGLTGIVLGILALFRPMPGTLLAVAVLVFGAAFLLGISRLNWLYQVQAPDVTRAAAATGSGGLLVGLAAVVLGILAIIGLVPMTLILVGLLSMGAGMLFNGSGINNGLGQ